MTMCVATASAHQAGTSYVIETPRSFGLTPRYDTAVLERLMQPARHDQAEHRRQALRQSLADAHINAASAAAAAGIGPNSIYNFLAGRSKSLSPQTLEALARVIPGATVAKLTGSPEPVRTPDVARSVLVQVQASAGLWRPTIDLPLAEQFEAPVPLAPGMRAAGAFGCLVRPPGAELLYPPETILVCIPLDRRDADLVSGNIVLLERVHPNGAELTVRELRLRDDKAWLWQRSDDPLHQSPVSLPWPWDGKPWRADGERRRLAGVVCGSWRPEG